MRIIDLSQDQFYGDDKSRDLIDDLIKVINLEILSLAKHGCKHIQLDEPVLMRYPKKALEYGVTDVIKCFEGQLFDKTQNHDLFISPKRKKTILEMSLKSSIMSKLDHQMSKMNCFSKRRRFLVLKMPNLKNSKNPHINRHQL